ncbi:unnamed protein product [Caenorhabditis angaria]|uniref:Uncharacterized protein n=1 Tax=Caenorhabditis angaria TaxID=860376 RepID=A0A9P1IZD1_9PELO|nr:unnamed protein product [Caenorhabditis angaria]
MSNIKQVAAYNCEPRCLSRNFEVCAMDEQNIPFCFSLIKKATTAPSNSNIFESSGFIVAISIILFLAIIFIVWCCFCRKRKTVKPTEIC